MQIALWIVFLVVLTGCARPACIADEREEEASSGVNISKSFHFESFDQNQDHLVTLDEYRERMAILFGIWEIDKNGKIDLGKECRDNPWCKPALARGKSQLTLGNFLDDAVEFLKSADKSGDDMLDRKEFSKLPSTSFH